MSTLDPNEIRKLPVQRDKPYNGLTKEQVLAIGGDPDAVEAGRLAVNEGLQEDAYRQSETLALAAARAVAAGSVTEAEAAQQLLAVDRAAHDWFTQAWRQQEGAENAVGDFYSMQGADAETWAAHVEGLDFER